jgi:transcription antitermination factor NusG
MTTFSKPANLSADSESGETVLPWYAVHVRSNCERLVHRALEDKGYELFLPMYSEQRRWSDRVKQVDVPLFPGYVFCRFDSQDRLPVLQAPGVVQIVGNGKLPVPIAEEEIEAVKIVLKSNLPYLPWPSLAPGHRVVVDRGPLMGVQGVLLQTRYPRRLVVSITMLHRAVAVELDANWVRPVDTATFSPLEPPSEHALPA